MKGVRNKVAAECNSVFLSFRKTLPSKIWTITLTFFVLKSNKSAFVLHFRLCYIC